MGLMDEHKDTSDFESVLVVEKNGEAEKMNGPSGLRGADGLVTYKRRKSARLRDRGKVQDEYDPVDRLGEKLCDQTGGYERCSHYETMSSHDCSLKNQRNFILEQICQSLDGEGGLRKCIENALAFSPGNGGRTTVKDSLSSCQDRSKCTSQTGYLPNGVQNEAKNGVGITSCGSVNRSNNYSFTELCQLTFFDIIKSEKFAQLCSLLLESFQDFKADKLFDLTHIHVRMKERAYENSPLLFHSDIQEIWLKLQKVGIDITALSKRLSDITRISFHEQVGNSAQRTSVDYKNEFLTQESKMHAKMEPAEACALDETHTCRHCGEKANGEDGLVCDSCEKMYHISCTDPPIKEIPTSWYCATCTSNGLESPHLDCTACERLNATSPFEETIEKLEQSAHEFVANEALRIRSQNCKICGNEVKSYEERRICGHSFCPHSFYHVKCLTSKQLISYGSRWYCPSCLCGVCLVDQDDDKIVLCDSCDHAYHIYCTDPPYSSIPKGKWFCKECRSGIQLIREARQSYENKHKSSKKRALDGKLKGQEDMIKSGGVDVLLNAANTLNHDENLVTPLD